MLKSYKLLSSTLQTTLICIPIIYCCLTLLLISLPTQAQAKTIENSRIDKNKDKDKKTNKNIDKIINHYVDHQLFTGTVLVAKKGIILHAEGYGKAEREWNVNNSVDAKFIIASMTKSFTALLIMQLVDEGKIKTSDKIIKHLSILPEDKFGAITIEQLLTHTSGIKNYFSLPGWTKGKYRKDISKEKFIAEMIKLELAFNPGEQRLYSNTGYFLLGLIIENVSNNSFSAELKTRILQPLKMETTGT